MLREHAGLGARIHTRGILCRLRALSRRARRSRLLCRYEAPPGIYWDDQKYHGEAYPAYAWSIHVAQVAVDTVTYSAEVEDFWAVQEVGRVLNPVLAAGRLRAASRRASATRSTKRWFCKTATWPTTR
jgi:CO/xanthine dehydrogenase Mo-binding subunit